MREEIFFNFFLFCSRFPLFIFLNTFPNTEHCNLTDQRKRQWFVQWKLDRAWFWLTRPSIFSGLLVSLFLVSLRRKLFQNFPSFFCCRYANKRLFRAKDSILFAKQFVYTMHLHCHHNDVRPAF